MFPSVAYFYTVMYLFPQSSGIDMDNQGRYNFGLNKLFSGFRFSETIESLEKKLAQ